MFEHYDSCHIRFAVYQKGVQKSEWSKSIATPSESYAPEVNRVFWGEQIKITDIEGDLKTHLIIEVYNTVTLANTVSTELVGWTLVQLFNDQNDLRQAKWCIPVYKPPTKFVALPCELTNDIWLVENSKLFLRICTPRNEIINFIIEKHWKLPDDYMSSEIYELGRRKPKFYSDWLNRHKEKEFKAKGLADRLQEDLEIIRKY
jgi:hypothetical protein